MVPDGILEPRVGAVVEERRSDGQISQRSRAELVAVGFMTGHLLGAEVLVLCRTVKDHVACADTEVGRDLRHTSNMVHEISKHFVRFAGHCVACDAVRSSGDGKRATLFGFPPRRSTTVLDSLVASIP